MTLAKKPHVHHPWFVSPLLSQPISKSCQVYFQIYPRSSALSAIYYLPPLFLAWVPVSAPDLVCFYSCPFMIHSLQRSQRDSKIKCKQYEVPPLLNTPRGSYCFWSCPQGSACPGPCLPLQCHHPSLYPNSLLSSITLLSLCSRNNLSQDCFFQNDCWHVCYKEEILRAESCSSVYELCWFG